MWPHRALTVLIALGFLIPSVTPWSASPLPSGVAGRLIAARIETTPTLSRSQRWLSSRKTRSFSPVHAVQARAVDMEDRQSIQELERETSVEDVASFEASLETTKLMDEEVQEMTQKILNGLFLAVSFGWAAYTIFSIDAGMTRGWTQSEIAMRIPLDNWSNYESSLMEKPVFTKTLINVVIYLLGDWLSQTVFQKKDVLDFDVSRTLKNGFIGE